VLAGSTPEVAVLKVGGASSMPTVPLGSSTAGARALGALGFTDVPGGAGARRLKNIPTHLAEVGGSTIKSKDLPPREVADAARLVQGLKQGMTGGPLVAEKGQVIGFLAPLRTTDGAGTIPRVVSVAAILKALRTARVNPHGGPVDRDFESGMHPFKNGGFAESIPFFTRALASFPGHLLAAENLAVAKSKAHGTVPKSGSAANQTAPEAAQSADGDAWSWALASMAAVLLLALACWLLLLRRRRMIPEQGGSAASDHGGLGKSPSPASSPIGAAAPAPVPTTNGGSRQSRADRSSSMAGSPTAPSSRNRQASAVAAPSEKDAPLSAHPHGHAEPSKAVPPLGRPLPLAAHGQASEVAPGHRAAKPGSTTDPDRKPSPSSDSSLFCTRCGARMAERHRYCRACGEPVTSTD
jgi:hypothetical protein